ncbi:MAG: homocysteine S-methyltransferase family protein [Clostridiales Family XIII bacterium]|jgi:5-methyltetrahydrofolate--homocysteine methyltransferase|nr:homocysteine S-methyltransferase family protein [Clostridiales Family XIII bacterium]
MDKNNDAGGNRVKTLLGGKVVLFDSAMGSSIIAAGALKQGEGSERVNVDAPRVIHDIHTRNIEAGCDVITTNTFTSHIGGGERGGDPGAEEEALRAGVRIARKAAAEAMASGGAAEGRRIFTALDVGPIGGVIGLTNELTHDDAIEIFARTVGIGAGEGADLILIETMADLTEALDAITAAKAETDLPVICSMTFDAGGRTFMGVSVDQFVEAALEAGADAVGANCSVGPDGMLSIAEGLVAAAGDAPVLVQPNAGQPQMGDGTDVYYDMTPDEFADGVFKMIEAGATLAGGCCGTTPEMIACLKRRIG